MGELAKISGPLIIASGMKGSRVNEVVKIGKQELIGEIIALKEDTASIQVYEDTSGLKPGDEVKGTGAPLEVELGPGLLAGIFDGTQRPLNVIKAKAGIFITRGVNVPALDRKTKWEFKPVVKKGDGVKAGDILGEVKEKNIVLKILVPNGVEGKVEEVKEGRFTVEETIAVVDGKKVRLSHRWPVRVPRPFKQKKAFDEPLVTGQRILDVLFPLAKGGAAAIPGGFGTGKCVSGETLVLLADGSLKTMNELYACCKKSGEGKKTFFEEVIELRKPLEVFSFSLSDNKIMRTQATTFYKGKSDKFVRIKTRSGRVLEVTPVHKLFKVTSELGLVETQAAELKPGEFIVGIRKLPELGGEEFNIFELDGLRVVDDEVRSEVQKIVKNMIRTLGTKTIARELGLTPGEVKRLSRKQSLPTLKQVKQIYDYFKMPLPEVRRVRGGRWGQEAVIPTRTTAKLAEFLGLFVSEGHLRGAGTILFTNADESLLTRFKELAEEVFGVKAIVERQRGKTPNVLVSSKAVAEYLKHLVGKTLNAGEKNVPATILSSSMNCVAAFLKAYFLGSGSINRGEVEFCTASKKLQAGVAYLLSRLGVVSNFSSRKVGRRTYYRVFVRGNPNLQILSEAFGVSTEDKIIKLRKCVEEKRKKNGYHTATDVVPVSPALLEEVYKQAGSPRSLLESKGVWVKNYLKGGEHISVQAFNNFVRVVSEKLEVNEAGGRQKQLQSQFSRLSQFSELLEWIYCDEITSVEEVSGPHDVFDISVPETQNWVGGFGASVFHNTVTQQSLAKFAQADIIVYVGCGERGNEMCEVLTQFPKLEDPRTGKPLMERTVLIANTSNMPVAAREASIYTGITIAEYFRDMGFNVALMADSTSRWAEALREIAGRLEEMPGEEGYPAYLGRKVAEFYERAGRVECLGSKPREGTVSVVGAVSPPGGDISEPVSQTTLRITKAFWALDSSLARRRHYPAIHWLRSYSLYEPMLEEWFAKNVAPDFSMLRNKAMTLLQQEADLQNIVQLIGPDALPDKERLVLDAAKMIREDFLQQFAFDPVDASNSLKKQYSILKTILFYYDKASTALAAEVPLDKIVSVKEKEAIAQLKRVPEAEIERRCGEIMHSLEKTLAV